MNASIFEKSIGPSRLFRVLGIIACLIFIASNLSCSAGSFNVSDQNTLNENEIQFICKKEQDKIILQNSLFTRILKIDQQNNGLYTISFKNNKTKTELSKPGSDEFSFKIDGKVVVSGAKSNTFDVKDFEVITKPDRKIAKVILTGVKNSNATDLDVRLYYEFYPDVPVVRKWIEIENKGTLQKALTDLEWERLNLIVTSPTETQIYSNYGQAVNRAPFEGGIEEPAVLVYDSRKEEGFILGNEAPGITRRIEVYPKSPTISIGTNPQSSPFAFKKFLDPGETFISPKSFIALCNGKKWQDAFEGHFADFLRKYLGVKLFERKNVPVFLYNTWDPFRKDINEPLIRDLADAVAPTGVEYFIIDDGWQNNRGDWQVDKNKFPNGLKPVFDYICSKGIKPGLWFALTDVAVNSKVYEDFKDCIVLDKNGNHTNIHSLSETEATMCLCTRWYDYILEKISHYVSLCNLGYVKIDISAVRSVYVQQPDVAGCYANHHAGHKGQQESLLLIYRRIMDLFDELKKRHPDLYIDCTFEIWGHYHLIDYALIEHADGDWLSNIRYKPPKGPLIVRQLGFDRARVVPASTMLIGNLQMQHPNAELSFLSLASYTPMMLGDPRKLTEQQKSWFRQWHKKLRDLQDEYQIFKYYQTSDCFVRPTLSGWDGCARFNKQKQGGILCFYRNESPEASRIFQIPWVDQEKNYVIECLETEKKLGEFTGTQLISNGLNVQIPQQNCAKILCIREKRF